MEFIMSNTDIHHMHEDIEIIKNDLALIKHILSEEGQLTSETKNRLAKARKILLTEYKEL